MSLFVKTLITLGICEIGINCILAYLFDFGALSNALSGVTMILLALIINQRDQKIKTLEDKLNNAGEEKRHV